MIMQRLAGRIAATCVLCACYCITIATAGTISSITTYADGLCTTGAKSVGVIAGLCYNSSFGDFLVPTLTATNDQAGATWMAAQIFTDAACTQLQFNTAEFANVCAMDLETNTWSVTRTSASTLASYVYSGCATECRNCTTKAKVSEDECIAVPGSAPPRWRKLGLLGIGSGAFGAQFFQTTDGSCGVPLAGPLTLVPDTQCLGQHAVQFSSL
jgi:hypothetical protein